MADKIKISFESKVFNDEPGSFIYINRTYASRNESKPDTDNLKFIKTHSNPSEYDLAGNPAFVGGGKKCNLENYEKVFLYKPLRDERSVSKKYKEYGLNKYYSERSKIYDVLDKKESDGALETKDYWETYHKMQKELDEKYQTQLEAFQKSERGLYSINDEFKVPLNAKNLDAYVSINKTNFKFLSREQIAEWYFLEDSYQWQADTDAKKETAIKNRRVKILKILPNDKQIHDLVDKDLINSGKKVISERTAKKADQDKKDRIAMGETTFGENLAYTFSQPQFYLFLLGAAIVFYLLYQLENWEPKETINCGNPQSSYEENACDRAYERTYEEKWGRKPGKLPKIP